MKKLREAFRFVDDLRRSYRNQCETARKKCGDIIVLDGAVLLARDVEPEELQMDA